MFIFQYVAAQSFKNIPNVERKKEQKSKDDIAFGSSFKLKVV